MVPLMYSMEMFMKDLFSLLKQINEKEGKNSFDTVLAIARGGIPLSHFLLQNLHIPHYTTLQIKSYEGQEQKRIEIVSEPEWDLIDGKRVLIAEDLIDSGKTMKYVLDMLKEHNVKDYRICVLIDKQKNPEINAHYYARSTKEWVYFFWEKEYFKKNRDYLLSFPSKI